MSLKYTPDHEWLHIEGDTATVGITHHAQDALGDVVFVELPEVGKSYAAKDVAGVVESVKAAADVYMPVSGEVTEVNEALRDDPSLANTDPQGAGWFFKLKLSDPAELDGLMDEAGLQRSDCMTTPKPLVRRDFLAEAKKRWNANIKSAKSVNRDRLLSIDPDEDAYVLGHQAHTPTLTNVEDVAPLPLFGANGVVHTIGDLAEDGTLKPDTEYLRYQDWCVTPKALACVIWWAYVIDEKTKGLIEDFRVYLAGDIERPSSESKLSAVNLSERVCAWGGRPSIFDNMKKAQKRLDDLEDKLNNWFFEALKSNPGQALERCADIKGLGPSFGSKHLRFIDPDRYATLDNILSQAFGFAMTGKGYEDFLQSLKTFKEAYRLPYCIADIEHGLFFLTQPFFSSSPPQEHKLNSDKSPMFGSIDVGTLTRDFEKVTTYSPLIDIYRHKEGIEHWFGMESRQDNARRKLKLLLTVHPVQDGKAEVSHFSLTSRALNMRQTKEYLSYLYPAFSASKANLEWEHLKPFPWEKQKPAKRS